MTQGLRARARGPVDCPYCREEVEPTFASTCPGCDVDYHPDCLEELGRCATLGCSHAVALPVARTRPGPAAREPEPVRSALWPRGIRELVVGLTALGFTGSGLYLPIHYWGAMLRSPSTREWILPLGVASLVLGVSMGGWIVACRQGRPSVETRKGVGLTLAVLGGLLIVGGASLIDHLVGTGMTGMLFGLILLLCAPVVATEFE